MSISERITRYVGDDWLTTINLQTSGGEPFNLNGYVPVAHVYRTGLLGPVTEMTTANGRVTVLGSPADGKILLTLERDLTSRVPPLPDDSPLLTTRFVLELFDPDGHLQVTKIIPILPLAKSTTSILQLPDALEVTVGNQGPPGADGLVTSVNGHSASAIVLDADDVGAYSKAEADDLLADGLAGRQPLDATLTALAALVSAANKLAYFTDAEMVATTDFPAYGRQVVGAASAAALKSLLALVKGDVGLGNVDNTSDANKPVSTAQATADGLRVLKAGDTMNGPLALSGDPTLALHAVTKQYADGLIAAGDAMVFKGVIDCSGDPNYPGADRGWTYRVSVAGKIGGASGVNVEAGDILLCLTDGTASGNQAAVGASWSAIQTNIDGAVTLTGAQTLTNKSLTSPAITSPTGLVKGDVGLGNVDNTSDASKPVSTAQATALGAKFDKSGGTITGTTTIAPASGSAILNWTAGSFTFQVYETDAGDTSLTNYAAGRSLNFSQAGAGEITFGTNGSARLRVKANGQVRLMPLSVAPASAESGDLYYDSTMDKFRGYAAGAWVDLH